MRFKGEPMNGSSTGQARLLAASGNYAGVIAWWRSADLTHGEFGDPVIIHEWGEVPEME